MTDSVTTSELSDDAARNIEAPPFNVGTALREARLQQGLSVDEISNRIKFAPRQIEALEANDFAHLPETAFLRGFVRSYARSLQLDPLPLLAALPHAPEQSLPLEEKALTEVPYDIYTERKLNILWLAAAFLVAILLALSAWLFGDRLKGQNPPEAMSSGAQNTKIESPVFPAAVPVSSVPDSASINQESGIKNQDALTSMNATTEVKNLPPAAPSPASPVTIPPAKPDVVHPVAANNTASQATIRLGFDGDSWVQISDKNGKLQSQLYHAGSEAVVNGTPPFSLVIGHAKAVHLNYKGQAVDLVPYIKIEVARLTLE